MPERNNEYVYPPAKFTEELRQRINNAGFSDEFKQQIKSAQKEEKRKMFERLTRWENNDKDVADLIEEKSDFDGLTEAIDRLAAYEDSGLSPEEVQELKVSVKICEDCWNHAQAKAEGRLVVLPCKVGDVVYEPFVGKVYEKTVDRIIINRFTTPQIWIETKLPFATPRLERWDMAIGKTVFLTREDAEKALGVGE